LIEETINSIIGETYNKDTNNCWHTVQKINSNAPGMDALVDIYRDIQRGEDVSVPFREVSAFNTLDIVLLGDREDHLHHAGVVYAGLIIHNTPSTGVIAQDIDLVKMNFKVIKGYRYVS